MSYFKKALTLAQANGEEVYEINVLVNMALVSEKLAELSQAIEWLLQATQLDPNNVKLMQKLQ